MYASAQINLARAPKLAANSRVPGMPKQILIIQAHPDASRPHLAHSLLAAYFRAHSVKSLERNVLGFVGIAPVQATLIGVTADMKPEVAAKWLVKLERLGVGAE